MRALVSRLLTMGRLRFCMLTTFYPPYHFGGDGVAVQRLAHGLVRRGHHVTVVHDVDAYHLLHPAPAPPAAPEPPGLEVHRLRTGVGALGPLLVHQFGGPVLNRGKIRGILARGAFDVVNFHNVSLLGGPGLLAEGGGIRLYMAHEHWLVCPTHVLWRHGREVCTGRECLRCIFHYRRPPQLWRFGRFLERRLRHVDAFIAMSEFSRAKHAEFGFPREMEVLPYFLPDPELDTPPVNGAHPRPYFLFVGRLERIKGLDDVIPLFRTYREADLLIAGEGEYGPRLQTLARGIPGVRFLGWLSREELPRYYRGAIALIMPSVCFETFGLVLVEAFREGTPVIARRIGSLPEIVERAQAGELFTEPAELLAAMERMRTDPARRERMGRAAYEASVHLWSEHAVVPSYLDLVRRVAERKGDGRVARAIAEDRARDSGSGAASG